MASERVLDYAHGGRPPAPRESLAWVLAALLVPMVTFWLVWSGSAGGGASKLCCAAWIVSIVAFVMGCVHMRVCARDGWILFLAATLDVCLFFRAIYEGLP
jgi:hypothetical protein